MGETQAKRVYLCVALEYVGGRTPTSKHAQTKRNNVHPAKERFMQV